MNRFIFPLLLALPLLAGSVWFFAQGKEASSALQAASAPVFSGPGFIAPIACDDPARCVVQNHVDLRAGDGVSDPACGSQSYDGHQGVDFRIPDLPAMMQGVPVGAVADGTVVRARDGEYDGAWLAKGREAIADRECGNGVAIRHEDGYETLYCHLRRNSIIVSPGQNVRQGQPLAEVGMSGRSEFPHVHLAVLREGKRLDPFTGRSIGEGCGDGTTLWQGRIPGHWQPGAGPFLFKGGFTDRPVTLPLVERGLPEPTTQSASLVFYARAVNLREGDVQRLQIEGPEGFEPIGMNDDPLENDSAQQMRFVGREARGKPFPAGEYVGRYQVLRGDALVLDFVRSIVIE